MIEAILIGAVIATGNPIPVEWPHKQEAVIVEKSKPRENRQERRKKDKKLHYTI